MRPDMPVSIGRAGQPTNRRAACARRRYRRARGPAAGSAMPSDRSRGGARAPRPPVRHALAPAPISQAAAIGAGRPHGVVVVTRRPARRAARSARARPARSTSSGTLDSPPRAHRSAATSCSCGARRCRRAVSLSDSATGCSARLAGAGRLAASLAPPLQIGCAPACGSRGDSCACAPARGRKPAGPADRCAFRARARTGRRGSDRGRLLRTWSST